MRRARSSRRSAGRLSQAGIRLAGEAVGDGVVLLDGHERKGRQHRVGGDEAQRLHAREALGAQDVPAPTISRHVPVDRSLRRLHGEVRRGVREVEEPRLVLLRARLAEELEGVVGEDVGDVELAGLIGEFGGRAGGQAHVLVRIPLIVGMGLQALVAVIGVEAALDRPGRTHVPLADHPGAVARLLQELGDGDVVVQQVSGVGGSALRRGLGGDEITDARFVRMQAGDERGARRTATRGRIDLLESRAGPGETVEVRRRDLAAVAAEIRVAEVVGQDDEHVGTARFSRRQHGRAGRRKAAGGSRRGDREAGDGALEGLELAVEPDGLAVVVSDAASPRPAGAAARPWPCRRRRPGPRRRASSRRRRRGWR
jgi:hypothetical protein